MPDHLILGAVCIYKFYADIFIHYYAGMKVSYLGHANPASIDSELFFDGNNLLHMYTLGPHVH